MNSTSWSPRRTCRGTVLSDWPDLHASWLALLSLVVLLAGCGSGDPFSYIPVSGKVTYDDGSLIQYEGVKLTFIPQTAPLTPNTFPRPGIATLDPATGEFHEVTSHTFNDGLVQGKHKVTLSTVSRSPLPPSVVPREYADPEKTPLLVDTAEQPFDLKVRKPKTQPR